MNILNMDVDDIKFQDVVDCCKQGTLESTTLDYKQALPKDLAKHFATFSNTLGGLIIIGVEEDPSTGRPKSFKGIKFEGKLIDQIHQFAANVTPYPRYKAAATDEVNGSVFILIKILPGDQQPYTPGRDNTIWIRTGNVSTPLRNPDSRELEQMHRRKEESAQIRTAAQLKADNLFNASLERATKEWDEQVVKTTAEPVDPFGQNVSLFTATIMPMAPSDPIIDYREIKNRVLDYREQSNVSDFPDLNYETVPNGISYFNWFKHDGRFEFGLVLDNGLLECREDVLGFNKPSGRKLIYLINMLSYTTRQLQAANKFYKCMGFNGLLHCSLTLTGAKDTTIVAVNPGNRWSVYDTTSKLTKLGDYSWQIPGLDTFKLNDKSALVRAIIDVVSKMYWDFGMTPPNENLVKDAIKMAGLSEDVA